MKYLLFISLLVLSGCDRGFCPDYTNGKATALRNGEKWEGEARGTVNNQNIGLNMYYSVYNDFGHLRQQLGFTKIPRENGTYALHHTLGRTDSITGINFGTLSDDGDVIEDSYNALEGENISYITVDSYDPTTRWFIGSFQATFFIDPDWPKVNPNNPDTIRFEKGHFEVRIEE